MALLTSSDEETIRSNSFLSLLKLFTVSMPDREFDKFALRVSMAFLIRVYRAAIVLVNLKDPKIITGIGINAKIAIRGEI